MQTYKEFLLAAVMPIIGGEGAAEDVLQETFLQIYRSLPQYGGGSFRSWAGRIAVNKAIDCHRRNRRLVLRGETLVQDETPMSSREGVQPSAETEALERMGLLRLRAAVSALPPIYREAFLRHYVDGASCLDMASAEGVSVRTVESRLYRAREMLRRRLREAGG